MPYCETAEGGKRKARSKKKKLFKREGGGKSGDSIAD